MQNNFNSKFTCSRSPDWEGTYANDRVGLSNGLAWSEMKIRLQNVPALFLPLVNF
jgi:hypothetical protein